MNSLDFLKTVKTEVNEFICTWYEEERGKYDEEVWGEREKEVIERIWEESREYVIGGKGVRGGLVALGYSLAGKDWKQVVPISAGVEMMHSFLLVHDDIIDRDVTRRGRKTVHEDLATFSSRWADGESRHLGTSLAIVTGDLLNFWGWRMWQRATLSGNVLWNAMHVWQQTLVETGYGEIGDVLLPYERDVSEELILKMYEQKTGKYTIAGPLKLGCVLGEIEEIKLQAVEEYGRLVGLAFQLRDDELGLYGNAGITGKGVGTDVKEKKMTLVRLKAMQLAGEEDKGRLDDIYRQSVVTDMEVSEVLRIVERSGARQTVREMGELFVEQAKAQVEKITKSEQHQQVLLELANYMVRREK